MRIGYSTCAASTRAFALIAEGWNELVQDGFTPDYLGTCPVSGSSEVIYAVSAEGDVVGVLTFDKDPDTCAIAVSLGYVEPSSRQQHVFTAMFKSLSEIALKGGNGVITVPIHPDNVIAKRVLERLRAVPVVVEYEVVVS